MVQFIIPAAQMAMGLIQQHNAAKANKRLEEQAKIEQEASLKAQTDIANKLEGQARALGKGVSTTSQTMKRAGDQQASEVLSTAARTGADPESVKASIAGAVKVGQEGDIKAQMFDEGLKAEGREKMTNAQATKLGIEQNLSDRIYKMMMGQMAGNAGARKAGIQNMFGGASDLTSAAIAQQLGLYDNLGKSKWPTSTKGLEPTDESTYTKPEMKFSPLTPDKELVLGG